MTEACYRFLQAKALHEIGEDRRALDQFYRELDIYDQPDLLLEYESIYRKWQNKQAHERANRR